MIFVRFLVFIGALIVLPFLFAAGLVVVAVVVILALLAMAFFSSLRQGRPDDQVIDVQATEVDPDSGRDLPS